MFSQINKTVINAIVCACKHLLANYTPSTPPPPPHHPGLSIVENRKEIALIYRTDFIFESLYFTG